MKHKWYALLTLAVLSSATVVCTRPEKLQQATQTAGLSSEQLVWLNATLAVLDLTATAKVATPAPEVTPDPVQSRTPSPTSVPSPTPTLPTDEEEYSLLYEQAQKEGRGTACDDGETLDCQEEILTYSEALLSLLQLPGYAEEEPLASTLNTIYDVVDPELERWLELAISLGLYPSEAWCGSSEHYVCPNRHVDRETAPMWLQVVILGPEVPQPCKDFFTDTSSPWVEALVCPLDVYQIRMNPYGMWRARDLMTKGDWDVLKEQLLAEGGGQ